MKSRKVRPLIVASAVLAACCSFSAEAKMKLAWHWSDEVTYGTDGTTIVSSHIVIDGYYDDESGVSPGEPSRYTKAGRVNSKMSTTDNRQISYRKSPDSGCTIPTNQIGVRGLPKGTKTWKIYIDPSLSGDLQSYINIVVNQINFEQLELKTGFKIESTSWKFLSDSYVIAPGLFSKPMKGGLRIRVDTTRGGAIRESSAEIDESFYDEGRLPRLAVQIVGQLLGLAYDLEADPSFPSDMDLASDDKSMNINRCMQAALSANINGWGDK